MYCMYFFQFLNFLNIYVYVRLLIFYFYLMICFFLVIFFDLVNKSIVFLQRLWCSWVVKGLIYLFYFGGDIGYNKIVFQQIGEKYGFFLFSVLLIGVYELRLFIFDKYDI